MLGLWLVEEGVISEDALDAGLRVQAESGGRLGDILIAEGVITPYVLYHAIASHTKLPFVDLLKTDWDKSLLKESDLSAYLQYRYVPIGYRKAQDSQPTAMWKIATSEPFDPRLRAHLAAHYGEHYCYVITSPLDIRRSIEQHFERTLSENSQFRLASIMPEKSAYFIVSNTQRLFLLLALALFGLLLLVAPYTTLGFSLLVANLLYMLALFFKTLIFAVGLRKQRHMQPVVPLAEAELPSYSILVPLYHEAKTIPHTLAALSRLNYPKHKLDIKLVLEADDSETLAAALHFKPSYQFDIIRVPVSEPRTKPKACNYALAFARGDIITIYDAEDRPDPEQLRLSAAIFDALPNEVMCVQAELRYDNAHENWLTRLFDMEYAVLFHYLLPGLERLHMPIPLGGTSNHINAAFLRDIGEWDPFNVTEDADLGIRLGALGFRTRTMDSLTLEESPISLKAWMRQRSRWIKGHMQTWLVHMRQPVKLYRTLGLHGFLGFHMFLGLPYFLFLTAPYVLVVSLLWAQGLFSDILPERISLLMGLNLAGYLLLHWVQGISVAHTMYKKNEARPPHYYQLREWLTALLFPLYWLLHIVTSFVALHQLIYRPHHWSKTHHNISVMR